MKSCIGRRTRGALHHYQLQRHGSTVLRQEGRFAFKHDWLHGSFPSWWIFFLLVHHHTTLLHNYRLYSPHRTFYSRDSFILQWEVCTSYSPSPTSSPRFCYHHFVLCTCLFLFCYICFVFQISHIRKIVWYLSSLSDLFHFHKTL